ncbi:hypothetical protein [Bdellovibrio reynosensis]|uniref:Uncharacterized protein n=1 Tax=Bdellovibrio reynosensis TaxID=2835041 RepID=A0ABY4CB72_9BACT|nr:hypothetical protein [Bdellovibrio reynosensis]UOF01142.1 hypothetical protein MNR06_15695 [Bdellovibrio reynosensis]
MKKLILFIVIVSSSSAYAFTRSNSISMLDDDGTDYTSNYTSKPAATSGGGGSGSTGPGIYDELNRYEPFRNAFAQEGSCDHVPTQVRKAFSEAVDFSKSCGAARLAPGKKIAINDYSGQGHSLMYIFDQNGSCIKAIPISWGGGNPRTGRMEACSTENSRKTPPGFHITAAHRNGAKYNQYNSLGLAGLCGQNSLGERGILIHGSRGVGRGSSWGCTGVPNFSEVNQLLGVGSLVYNYFGSKGQNNCSDPSGFEPRCEPEALAYQAANESHGGGVSREYRGSSSGRANGSGRGKRGAR